MKGTACGADLPNYNLINIYIWETWLITLLLTVVERNGIGGVNGVHNKWMFLIRIRSLSMINKIWETRVSVCDLISKVQALCSQFAPKIINWKCVWKTTELFFPHIYFNRRFKPRSFMISRMITNSCRCDVMYISLSDYSDLTMMFDAGKYHRC